MNVDEVTILWRRVEMLYIDKIKESVKNNEPLFLLSLSATREEILNADVDELAYNYKHKDTTYFRRQTL